MPRRLKRVVSAMSMVTILINEIRILADASQISFLAFLSFCGPFLVALNSNRTYLLGITSASCISISMCTMGMEWKRRSIRQTE